jgi:hypothetical protein
MGKIRVGVVGYSDKKFDKAKAKAMIEKALDLLKNDVEIVSGLTYLGVPAIAYDIAKERGLSTVGVACLKAEKYECFPVDKKVIEGAEWGDESEKFLSMIDVMIKVGGGKQSIAEAQKAKEMGITVIEYALPILQ